jgi:hypothetical protein
VPGRTPRAGFLVGAGFLTPPALVRIFFERAKNRAVRPANRARGRSPEPGKYGRSAGG